jgi:hypothetical protein
MKLPLGRVVFAGRVHSTFMAAVIPSPHQMGTVVFLHHISEGRGQCVMTMT